MPKLKGIEEKYLFGKAIDKENETCFFTDSDHSYTNKLDGTHYISCTQLLNHYCNEFNSLFFAKYKALEELADYDRFSLVKSGLLATQIWKNELLEKCKVDREIFEAKVKEILDAWEKNRIESAEKGTAAHDMLETSFYGQKRFDLSKYGCSHINGEYTCTKGYYKLDLDNGIYPELLISYISPEGVHIAGTADLVVKSGNQIDIIDWKTSKEIKKRSYFNAAKKQNIKMKYPLNTLEDSNYWHYALQLSLYGYMLQQQHPEFEIRSLTIVQVKSDGSFQEYPCQYLKEDVERMIKHYAKSLKTKEKLDKNKPFIV